jgi:hypothetical protein
MLRGFWMNEWQKAHEWTYPVLLNKNRKDKNKSLLEMT